MTRRQYFTAGFKDGIPICLGYIAVSFTFGIMAKKVGISIFDAVLISLTNVTSAGQFAGLSLIASTASYIEMAITQLIINLRYCLMSCALSQKIDPEAPLIHRFFIAYGVTDEIFGVTVCKGGKLSPFYSYGVIFISVFGWVFGTFLGILSGNILPARVVSALSVALMVCFWRSSFRRPVTTVYSQVLLSFPWQPAFYLTKHPGLGIFHPDSVLSSLL